jgi:hypothetical protein
MDCPLCNRLRDSEDYAKHYADFYVHSIAEKEGRAKAPITQQALQTAGIKATFADAFCTAYRAAYDREYEGYRKKFWDFFTEWDYHACSPEEQAAACCYHDEGFSLHRRFTRHPDEEDWDKETTNGHQYDESLSWKEQERLEKLGFHRCRVDEQLHATIGLPAGTPPPPPVSAELAAAGQPPIWRLAAPPAIPELSPL